MGEQSFTKAEVDKLFEVASARINGEETEAFRIGYGMGVTAVMAAFDDYRRQHVGGDK